LKTIIKVALAYAPFAAAVLTAANLTGSHTGASAPRTRLADQPAADPSGGICRPLRFYGVRGSGETTSQGNGYGTTVQQFEQTLTGEITGLGYLPATEVEYPAIPFGYAWQDYAAAYNDSVAAGENALQTDLADLWHQCPSTYVVLAGYSQGAQVAGDVADTLKLPQAQAGVRAAARVHKPGSPWPGRP
jgi:Cutinase